jgi:hypothetical protein
VVMNENAVFMNNPGQTVGPTHGRRKRKRGAMSKRGSGKRFTVQRFTVPGSTAQWLDVGRWTLGVEFRWRAAVPCRREGMWERWEVEFQPPGFCWAVAARVPRAVEWAAGPAAGVAAVARLRPCPGISPDRRPEWERPSGRDDPSPPAGGSHIPPPTSNIQRPGRRSVASPSAPDTGAATPYAVSWDVAARVPRAVAEAAVPVAIRLLLHLRRPPAY